MNDRHPSGIVTASCESLVVVAAVRGVRNKVVPTHQTVGDGYYFKTSLHILTESSFTGLNHGIV